VCGAWRDGKLEKFEVRCDASLDFEAICNEEAEKRGLKGKCIIVTTTYAKS